MSPLWLQPFWSGWGMVQVREPSRPVTCKHSATEKHFQTWNIWKLATARHSNLYILANIFWPFSSGHTLTSRSDDRAINYASARDRADTLCEHRMYFMKTSEDSLPSDLIWLSDMPWAAAVVAGPIGKLCGLNCLRQKWQNCRAPRSCSLNLATWWQARWANTEIKYLL